jgi:hypothetical protein
MTDRERIERFQHVLRTALPTMLAQRLSDDLDEWFWSTFRDALLGAGATDREIDSVAAYMVTMVVDGTAPDSEARREQFGLIAQHLAERDMHVRIGGGDSSIWVEFPQRPRIY